MIGRPKSRVASYALFVTLLVAYRTATVTACTPGWKGEAFQIVKGQVENEDQVESVRQEILEETRSTFTLEELDIYTDPQEAWTVPPVDSNGDDVHEYFFSRFQGMVNVPQTGQYKLYLTADDGAIIFVDGDLVVDNDGRHASRERSTLYTLDEGKHFFEILYYEWWGNTRLKLEWKLESSNGNGDGGLPIPNQRTLLDSRWVCHFDRNLPRIFLHGPATGNRIQTRILDNFDFDEHGLSVSLWVRTTETSSQSLLSLTSESTATNELTIFLSAVKTVDVYLRGQRFPGNFDIVDGGWHMIFMSWRNNYDDETAVLRLEVDGNSLLHKTVQKQIRKSTGESCLMVGQMPRFAALSQLDSYDCGEYLDDRFSFQGYFSSIYLWNRTMPISERRQLQSFPTQLMGEHSDVLASLVVGYYDDNITRAELTELPFTTHCGGSGSSAQVVGLRDISGYGHEGIFLSNGEHGIAFFQADDEFSQPHALTDNLPLWLQAPHEGGQSNFPDLSGNGNDGVLVGDVRFGVADDSMRLPVMETCWDGHVEVPGLRRFNWTAGFTLSIFFRRLSGALDQSFVGNGFARRSGGGSIEIYGSEDFQGNNVASRVQLNSGSSSRSFVASAALRHWHHAVVKYNPSEQKLYWYVDGNCAKRDVPHPGQIPVFNSPLFIGASSHSGSDRMCAQVHDVRLYGRPMGDLEIRKLYDEMHHGLLFGETATTDCIVSDWSEWSTCMLAEELFEAVNASELGSTLRIRHRTIQSGSQGCPHLREWERCDPDIEVATTTTGNEVKLDNQNSAEVKIRLSSRPEHEGNVTVLVDSESAAAFFTVSKCQLVFNQDNWNQWQSITLVPKANPYSDGTSMHDIRLTALNYGGVNKWRTMVSAGNFTHHTLDFAEVVDSSRVQKQVFVSMNHGQRGQAHCRSWGDPHMVTFDTMKYDFFGVGDFYLARSCDGKFAVQVRQIMCFSVSCNQAVIVKYRSQVVGLHVDNRNRNNPLTFQRWPEGSTGIRVHRIGPGSGSAKYRFSMPDGSEVEVKPSSWRGFHYLDLSVVVSGRFRGNINGLCALWNGDKNRNFIGSDGESYVGLTPHPHHDRHTFGMTWLVPPEENLFLNGSAVIPRRVSVGYTDTGSCSLGLENEFEEELVCKSGTDYVVDPDEDDTNPGEDVDDVTPGDGDDDDDDDEDDDEEEDDDDFGEGPNPSSAPDPKYDCSFDDEELKNTAESKCAKNLLTSDFAQFCNSSGVDIQSHYETCLLEVCLVNDTGTISSALDALIEECLDITLPDCPSPSPTSPPTPSSSPTYDPVNEDDPDPLPSPSPASTATSSMTSSPSVTSTPSKTSTPSSTRTSTNTVTPSSSNTKTPTSSVTGTQTPTRTASKTPTNTVTPSNTRTPTSSVSATSTSTPTITKTGTPSSTQTPTSSVTKTATATSTKTGTPSRTKTPTSSVTGTETPTRTQTRTPTNTATPSSTKTPTSSVTATATSTPTSTKTGTPTATPTPTSSVTVTETPTRTQTGTPTNTATSSSTRTPTSSVTRTATSTPTSTKTGTPTTTQTPSVSVTVTETPTRTQTGTPTNTATSSRTRTPTSSVTRTATSTPTSTKTGTPTATQTPTVSGTVTETPTRTQTGTPSHSATSSSTRTPSSSVSGTSSSTPTSTKTGTPSTTKTPTGSVTRTVTPSSTKTGTPSVTKTPTSSVTGTETATGTPTETPTNTATASGTRTPTSSVTGTTTSTPSNTKTTTPSTTKTPTTSVTRTATATSTKTGTPAKTASPSSTGTPTVTRTKTPSNTASSTTTASASETASPSGLPCDGISEECAKLSPVEKLRYCPSLCGGNGVCTCRGCVCSKGWTGRACNVEMTEDYPLVSEFHPDSGLMAPGQVVDVAGDNFISSMIVNSGSAPCSFYNDTVLRAYECVIRDRLDRIVARFPFKVTRDSEGYCSVPSNIDELLYGTDEMNQQYSDLVDPALQCPLVPRRQTVQLEVHIKEPRTILGRIQYMLGRCRPSKWYHGGVSCLNGGRCSRGGYCVCPPGWCGSKCNISSTSNGCGGNEHPDLPMYHAYVLGNWSSPHGSDVEGLTAMEGDVQMGHYSVGALWPSPSEAFIYGNGSTYTDRDDLAVKGTLTFWSGAVLGGGNIVYGSDNSYVPVPASVESPGRKLLSDAKVPFPVDFHGARNALRGLSQRLASLPRTATAHIRFTTLYLKGVRSDVNVFHVNAHDLLRARTIDLDLSTLGEKTGYHPFSVGRDPLKVSWFRPYVAPPGEWDPDSVPTTIINVIWNNTHTEYGPGDGDLHQYRRSNASLPAFAYHVSLLSKGLTGDFYRDNYSAAIIWNLPVARNVHLEKIDLVGTLLAPNAHVNFPTGQMRGHLWSKSFRGQGQINLPLYRGTCHPEMIGSMLNLTGGEINLEWLRTGATFNIPFDSASFGEGNVTLSYPIKGRRNVSIEQIDDLVGRFGAPPIPECRPYGYMTKDYECECWDTTYRRGVQCRTRCIDYCNGRGMCNATNPDVCDCFDPLRWTGRRCGISRCGENAWVSQSDPLDEDGNVKCRCLHGWKGPDCSTPIDCKHGTLQGGVCVCEPGFSGLQCFESTPQHISCYHGEVVRRRIGGTDDNPLEYFACKCSSGWTGRTCNQREEDFSGYDNSTCLFGYYSPAAESCICDNMWSGERCDVRLCDHGDQVAVPHTGSIYGTVPELENAVASGNKEAEEMLPPVGYSARAFNPMGDGIQLKDRDPQYRCTCHEGWFGPACDRHCREVCNFRGTACPSNSSINADIVTCTCEAPWTGSQCENMVIDKPATDPSDNDTLVTKVIDLSYISGDAAALDRLRGLRQLTDQRVQISAQVGMTAGDWAESSVVAQTGTNEEVSGMCEVIMSSDFSVAAGEDSIGFGPAKRLAVSCLPVRLKFNTSDEVTVELTVSLGTSLRRSITDEEEQMMFASLVNTDVFDGGNPSFVYSSMQNFDRKTGELKATVTLSPPSATLHLMVLQPNIEERSVLLAQGADDGPAGSSNESSLSNVGILGIVVGTVVVGFALITGLFIRSVIRRNRKSPQRVQVVPAGSGRTDRRQPERVESLYQDAS